jgi:hypothetical protein
MLKVTFFPNEPEPASLKYADTRKVGLFDLGSETSWADLCDASYEEWEAISLTPFGGRQVDADKPAIVGLVEADHAEPPIVFRRNENDAVRINDRLCEPRHVAFDADNIGRLAHRNCVGIVAPLENIEGVFDRGPPDLNHGRYYRPTRRGLSRVCAAEEAL